MVHEQAAPEGERDGQQARDEPIAEQSSRRGASRRRSWNSGGMKPARRERSHQGPASSTPKSWDNNPAQRIVYLDRVRRELAETKQVCSFRVAAGTRGASATVALTHTLTNMDSNPFGSTLL
jgi:hypothetical protein